MNEIATEQKSRKRKRAPRKNNGRRQPIHPTAIYSRIEAASMVGCSAVTLIRAYAAGYLSGYRQGRLIKHSGKHLLDWLASGGRTGWRKGGGQNG